jgi:hypothetical protein
MFTNEPLRFSTNTITYLLGETNWWLPTNTRYTLS